MSTRKSAKLNTESASTPESTSSAAIPSSTKLVPESKASSGGGSETLPSTPTTKDGVNDMKKTRRAANATTPTTAITAASTVKKEPEDEDTENSDDGDDDATNTFCDSTKKDDKNLTKTVDSPKTTKRKINAKEAKVATRQKRSNELARLSLPSDSKRSLRLSRRFSTGKVDMEPARKRPYVRRSLITPEPNTPNNKRKRTNSIKSEEKDVDGDKKPPTKTIKIEKIDNETSVEDEIKLIKTDSIEEKVEMVKASEEVTNSDKQTDKKDIPKLDEIINEVDNKTKVEIKSEEDEKETEAIIRGDSPERNSNEKDSSLVEDQSPVDDDVPFSAYERPKRGRPPVKVPPQPRTLSRKKTIINKKEPVEKKSANILDNQIIKPASSIILKSTSNPSNDIEKAVILKDASVEKDKVKEDVEKELIVQESENKDKDVITPVCTEKDAKIDVVQIPLTVDTTTPVNTDKESSPGTSSVIDATLIPSPEKAASLSPDLISEGVSVISVKQFYKKPEFLENNLGIEKDPKLGGIVQKVDETKKIETTNDDTILQSESSTPPAASTSINANEDVNDEGSNSSLVKEGELLIDDSTDDKIAEDDDDEISLTIDDDLDEEKNTDNINDKTKKSVSLDDASESAKNFIVNALETNIVSDEDTTKCDKNTAVDIKNGDGNRNLNLINVDVEIIDDKKKEKIVDDDACNDEKVKDIPVEKEKILDISNISLVEETTKIESKINDKTICDVDNDDNKIDDDDDDKKIDKINEITLLIDGDSGVSDINENNSSEQNDDIISKEIVIKEVEDDKKLDEVSVPDDLDVEDVIMLDIDNDEKDIIEKIDVDVETVKDEKKPAEDECLNTSENNETVLHETPETLKEKENHLKNLGLLTLKAAVEAKIEKQRRRRDLMQSTPSTSGTSSSKKSNNGSNNNSINIENGKGLGGTSSIPVASSLSTSSTAGAAAGNTNKNSQEYTGTLKTVIKLNRQANSSTHTNDKRKSAGSSGGNGGGVGGGRLPLKMTFQKGKGRTSHNDKDNNSAGNSGEETYYTIQNEADGANQDGSLAHGRKSHNRSHTTDVCPPVEIIDSENKDEKEIVIPEKASSFSIHPGRLCQDQCFYCGGRFGLYDTPCHVAQFKSVERQRKILENEEKLTVDNCLCDACFRHVDRRANCPSYKKKLIQTPNTEGNNAGTDDDTPTIIADDDKLSSEVNVGQPQKHCFVTDCKEKPKYSMRKRFIRRTVRKLLPCDFSLYSLTTLIPVCETHHEFISHHSECALCKRRLVKNHLFHITQEIPRLEKLLAEQGLPVKLHNNNAVCKLCRYFTNLLEKPPDGKSQKIQFVKNYKRRLLHFYNIQSGDASEGEEKSDESENKPRPAPAKRGRKPKKREPEQSTSQRTSRDDSNTPQSSEDGLIISQSTTASGQIVLDNDVMVDYDVPIIHESPSPPNITPTITSKLQTILQSGSNNKKDDISIVLRSNPNISMRELFPGEEEMGLQFNATFGGSSSHRTPEGWTRVQTFLQYDEPTRRLWEDLQKPYGNQSSFLRHLILLEKYFRNGDLVLSQNASSTATTYSETVQNRLRSYDSATPKTAGCNININLNTNLNNSSSNNSTVANRPPTISELLQQSQKIQQQFSNSPITITARPKPQQPATQNSSTTSNSTLISNSSNNNNNNVNRNTNDSILKSNLLGRKHSSIEILPITSNANNNTINNTNTSSASGVNKDNMKTNSNQMTKQQKILAAASRLINHDDNSSNQSKNDITNRKNAGGSSSGQNINLPPELISINRNIQNSLLLAKNFNNKQQNQMQQMFQQHHQQQLQQHQQQQQQQQPQPGTSKQAALSHSVIKLPETLTTQERLNSKSWRPTLMPVSGGQHLLNQSGQLYQTADGRKLPALVQVQSGGRPYLISIHDYNRMCILRREKIMREQMLKTKSSGKHQQQQQMQNKMQIPNKVLEQNSLIPVMLNNRGTELKGLNTRKLETLLSTTANSTGNNNSNMLNTSNLVPIAPKNAGNHLQIIPHSIASQRSLLISNSGGSGNTAGIAGAFGIGKFNTPTTSSNSISLMPTTVLSLGQNSTNSGSLGNTTAGGNNASPSWLWGNTNDNMNLNGALSLGPTNKNMLVASSSSSSASSSPSTLKQQLERQQQQHQLIQQQLQKQQQQQQNQNFSGNSGTLVLDSSLLSKIPKSLTVIPQQKERSSSRVNSIED